VLGGLRTLETLKESVPGDMDMVEDKEIVNLLPDESKLH
jgi:hypothetical protein